MILSQKCLHRECLLLICPTHFWGNHSWKRSSIGSPLTSWNRKDCFFLLNKTWVRIFLSHLYNVNFVIDPQCAKQGDLIVLKSLKIVLSLCGQLVTTGQVTQAFGSPSHDLDPQGFRESQSWPWPHKAVVVPVMTLTSEVTSLELNIKGVSSLPGLV